MASIASSIFSRSLIGSKSIRSKSFTFSSNLIIERVKILSSGAVKVEPPITDEIVLVEECSIRTEEAVLGKTSSSISCANMECLTFSLGISIVTWKIDTYQVLDNKPDETKQEGSVLQIEIVQISFCVLPSFD